MSSSLARFLKMAASSIGLVAFGCVLTIHAARPTHRGLPTDWSHQHLVFSRPASPEAMARLSEDPRYWMQVARHQPVHVLPSTQAAEEAIRDTLRSASKRHKPEGFWSINLGSGASPGAANYPAKYAFNPDVTPNCAGSGTPDYVVYSTGLAGGLSQASIAAFDNLYSGFCTGTVPQVFWGYNTLGTVFTSPALSEDGSQIAFVETNGGAGTLVLLTWKANDGTVSTPTTLSPTLAASYRGCTAPCMTVFPLLDGVTPADDTTASAFIDYSHDIAWVGDSNGFVHKFTGVFKGTPAEAGSPWPVQLNPSSPKAATSAIYDFNSTEIFVGDQGGFIYKIDTTGATAGTVTKSAQVDFGTGFISGPLVDSTGGVVFAFSSSDGTSACNGGTTACSAVDEFTSSFASGATGLPRATVGGSTAVGTTPNPLYLGALDTSYFNNFPRNGNLYVCGATGGQPTLFQVSIAAGEITGSNSVTVLANSPSTPACSPVSDISQDLGVTTGAEERMFVSLQNNGRAPGCNGSGCIVGMIDLPWQPSTTFTAGQIILASSLGTMIATNTGKTATTVPTWPARYNTGGTLVTDGGITWLDQGALTARGLPNWVAGTPYALTNRIVDPNNNIEIVTTAGTSGGTQPTWSTTLNTTTSDGGVTWLNAGPIPITSLEVTGGTSGIIMDNGIIPVGGGSQVYFGTLGNQPSGNTAACGGNGCAIQASQSALK